MVNLLYRIILFGGIMDKTKLIKTVVLLAAIAVIVGGMLRAVQGNSLSLTEYENQNLADHEADIDASDEPTVGEPDASSPSGKESDASAEEPSADSTPEPDALASTLTGASLNGSSQLENRVTYTEGFYYEAISDNLRRYITGISYPAEDAEITLDELRYVHIWHYNFDGDPTEGELICNEAIAQDLVEIFYELYRNEYQLEQVHLIDEYDGDDISSMEANNTSCFNYRPIQDSTKLSKHALGLAVDINPLYNPYITYNTDGTEDVSPVSGSAYADRSISFSYKIDESDLCYKLFTQHGFTWGGNWNICKDYQHFQKTVR